MKTKLFLFISTLLLSNVFFANNIYAKSFAKATPENPYTISVIGDSISFEPSYATVINENPCIKVSTYAIGATQVAGKDNPESFVNRTRAKWFNSDLIMIMGGTNDYLGINALCNNLGDISSKDTNTFCGAYNVMIKNIKNLNPNSRIVLITPIKRVGYNDPNIYGYNLSSYVDAVKMIAAGNGVTCIDLYNDSECDFITSHFLINGTEMHFKSRSSSYAGNNGYLVDGLHPTIDGHRVIANTLMKYILNF